ncbi:glycoside hydrolase family 10 protein [Alkaliflexus imshenetskii]|uniref:hypothetical protein n=1 Tax=Alkaliflexus imshenetskii TaxID=286730 RepID=UPI00047E996E|nr:hypothetical protein [Alkaliflexus imshenetskii]
MRLLLSLLLSLFLSACTHSPSEKIMVYAWMGGPGDATDQEIGAQFANLKQKGVDALLYNGGHNPEVYQRVGEIAKAQGLKFHAWIPTLLQGKNDQLKAEYYVVNSNGESALEKPAYVGYYTFLCPSHEGVFHYLENIYLNVAKVPSIDGVHLDYIRFPDVILARGLWEKYGLTMDREYPEFDYCYCSKCTDDFAEQSGININEVEDPSQVEEWKQFRRNLITNLVNRLAQSVLESGKEITAAVFPGPHSVASQIVRQEWDLWNLDAVFPMNYNDFYLEDAAWVGDVTREGVESLGGKFPLYSGLFICPDPENRHKQADPENHGLTPDELRVAIKASMDNGAAGICLFTPGRMTDAHWTALRETIYAN